VPRQGDSRAAQAGEETGHGSGVGSSASPDQGLRINIGILNTRTAQDADVSLRTYEPIPARLNEFVILTTELRPEAAWRMHIGAR
jgi:hypothetical protein